VLLPGRGQAGDPADSFSQSRKPSGVSQQQYGQDSRGQLGLLHPVEPEAGAVEASALATEAEGAGLVQPGEEKAARGPNKCL